jgi:hypothetical protein
MSLVKWAKSRIEKNRRSRRGISTIMANLTMLVIVVSLSSLLFVWAISSFGAYQGGAGYWFSSRSIANQERISVENVYFGSSTITIYVRCQQQGHQRHASLWLPNTKHSRRFSSGTRRHPENNRCDSKGHRRSHNLGVIDTCISIEDSSVQKRA